MNRPIKFRAWDTSNKRWCGSEIVLHHDGWIEDEEIDDGRDDVIILFFTGLLDKNGKEIFEGDILDGGEKELGGTPMRVLWNKESGAWMLEGLEYMMSGHTPRYQYWEIIGNIYESPELLTSNTTV